MKAVAAALALTALTQATCFAALEIGKLRWNQANLETLRSFDKAAVVTFLDARRRAEGLLEPISAGEIGDFQWRDLSNDGRVELVVKSAGRCASFFSIFEQDSMGHFTVQSVPGRGTVKEAIRDLNGNGISELVIYEDLISFDCGDTWGWPAVYRMTNGKYVEASRDFPSFYDREILPRLAKRIDAAKARLARGPFQQERIALTEMERDKILRVLGREPTAGLQDAYSWMKSSNPHLLQAAAVTFQDIGGHEKEMAIASERQRQAECRRTPELAMCKNAATH